MASTSANPSDGLPTKTQLLFARAVILTMELWPAMRLAVSEQWGGVESADKKQFLISHICDTYSEEPSESIQDQIRNSTTSSSTVQLQSPKKPDIDDLAETLEMYFEDEFESKVEDGSTDWVAGRIAHLHQCIYQIFPSTKESLEEAEKEVNKLYEATIRLKGQKVEIQRTQDENGDEHDGSGDDSSDEDEDVEGEAGHHNHAAAAAATSDAMDVDGEGSSQPAQARERQQPIVDEDGFTTVVRGRR